MAAFTGTGTEAEVRYVHYMSGNILIRAPRIADDWEPLSRTESTIPTNKKALPEGKA